MLYGISVYLKKIISSVWDSLFEFYLHIKVIYEGLEKFMVSKCDPSINPFYLILINFKNAF